MRKRWDIESIELNYYEATPEKEKDTLDELTDILYSYFSQLELKSNQPKATAAVSKPQREDR